MIESPTQTLLRPSNPFSTHRVRPGEIAFRFESGGSVDELFTTLKKNRWRGQIVGPHGSGKSTLLKTLELHWPKVGRDPIVVSLHNAQRRMPKMDWLASGRNSQVIVDGFEQLSLPQRALLRLRCRISGSGLLITTHHRVRGFPVAFETATSSALVYKLVDDLAGGLTSTSMDRKVVDACFEQTAGNVRETFMLLYDKFHATRSVGCQPARKKHQ